MFDKEKNDMESCLLTILNNHEVSTKFKFDLDQIRSFFTESDNLIYSWSEINCRAIGENRKLILHSHDYTTYLYFNSKIEPIKLQVCNLGKVIEEIKPEEINKLLLDLSLECTKSNKVKKIKI